MLLSEPRPTLRRLLPYTGIVFLGFLTIGLPLPVLPQVIHAGLGFGDLAVGLLMAAQSAATLLTRPYAGTLSDSQGGKSAVLWGLAACVLTGLVYLLSVLPDDRWVRLAVMLSGRLLLGFGESLLITGSLAWAIGATGTPGRVMVWIGVAMYSALGVGAPAGLLVMHWAGFPGVALATAGLPAAALVVAVFCPPVQPHAGPRLAFRNVLAAVTPSGAAMGFAQIPFAAISMFLPLAYLLRGWQGSGWALTGFGTAYVTTRLLGAAWPDRYGARPVALASLLVEAAGQGALWQATTPGWAVVGAALTGAGCSLVFPALGVAAIRRVPPANRGAALGGFVAFFDLALALAGPALGVIGARTSIGSVFAAGLVATVVAAAATVIATSKENSHELSARSA